LRRIEYNEWIKLVESMSIGAQNFYLKGPKDVEFVYGVPRGGILLAMKIAELTDLKFTTELNDKCLVVDDLIDSGRTMEKFKDYPFFALITKKENEWIEFWYENTNQDTEDLVVRQLEFIGEDPKREGLIDTPKRVIKMWKELFKGYDKKQKPRMAIFENGHDGLQYDEMIIDSGDYYSQCEHHMVPFFGKYWFAYIPDKKILGLSKVARMIDYYSAKLQIQERLVKEVLDEIESQIKPLGIALVMRGRHLCKEMRGVKKKGEMITSDLRGVFKDKPEARAEFMRFVK